MDFDEAFDRLFSRTASDNEDERRIAPFWLGAIGLLIFVFLGWSNGLFFGHKTSGSAKKTVEISGSGKSSATLPSGAVAALPPVSEPLATEPDATEPPATEPPATQALAPAATQPATTQPATSEPAPTQPAPTQPATTQPATTQPVAAVGTSSQLVATASEAGTVVLTGSVPNEASRASLDDAFTRALPPGTAFENQLTVDSAVSIDGAYLKITGTARPDLFDALGKVATDATNLKLAAENEVIVAQTPVLERELNALFAAEPIQFVYGSAAIDSKSDATLGKAAALFAAAPTGNGEIEGHTDNRGNAASNQALSEARAENVRRALIGKGVAEGRLTAVGYGQDRPIADNATPGGRARNRRVEVLVTE